MRDLPLDADVAEALGGSRLIGEELRGDLKAARAAADRALATAARPAEFARAQAQVGAVALLQGDLHAAVPAFEASLRARPQGRIAKTVATLHGFALYSDRRLLADGAEAASMPLLVRGIQKSEALKGGDPGFLAALAAARRAVSDARATGQAHAALPAHLKALHAATPPGWKAFAALAAADLTRRAGRKEKAERRWEAARALYAGARDRAGVALCELTHADWALARRPASPVSSGVALRERAWSVPAPEFAPPTDLAVATEALERARSGFDAAHAPRGVAAVELRESYLALVGGDPASARAAADRAKERFARAGDLSGTRLAEAHGCLADVAAGHGAEALGIARNIGAWGVDPGAFAFACGIGLQFAGAADRWRDQGRLEAALAANELASALSEGLGEPFGAIDALAARAAIHDGVGETATAAALLEEALEIADTPLELLPGPLRDPAIRRAATCSESLRAMLHTLEDPDALERLRAGGATLREAVVAAARIHAPKTVPALEREYAAGGAADAATVHLYRAWRALEHDAVAAYEGELANARTVARTDPDGGPWLEMLVHRAADERAEAREAFARMLAGNGGSGPRRDLAAAVMVEDWAVARQCLDALGGAWPKGEEPWKGLVETARVLEAEGSWSAALERFDAAVEDVARRHTPIDRGAQRVADAAPGAAASNVAVHAARAYLGAAAAGAGPAEQLEARAFELLEGRKARALLDLAASGAAAAALRGIAEPDAERWRELNARAGRARERIAEAHDPASQDNARDALERAQRALQALEDELRAKRSPLLAVLSPPIAPPGLAELCAALPEDAAMLHYTIAPGELIAVAVTRDGIAATHRAPAATRRLAADIARFRVLCKAGQSDRWRRLGKELGDLLLGPFDRVLDEHDHLWIVPSQAAHGLPFAALLRGEEPLVASHVPTVLPSAGLAQLLDREPKPLDGPALLLGDPERMTWPGQADRDGANNALPWAAAEAAAGAQAFGVAPLLGPAATETELRRRLADGRRGLAFLATHGAFEDPALASVLLMAEGEWLSVFELLGSGLDVELMVLSACESGRSVVRAGDELQGFPAAVLAAGVRGVLATLWTVSDSGTSVFMRDFLARVAAGERPRCALAAAQRRLQELTPAGVADEAAALRAAAAEAGRPLDPAVDDPPGDLSHPRYWAPFVLFGR